MVWSSFPICLSTLTTIIQSGDGVYKCLRTGRLLVMVQGTGGGGAGGDSSGSHSGGSGGGEGGLITMEFDVLINQLIQYFGGTAGAAGFGDVSSVPTPGGDGTDTSVVNGPYTLIAHGGKGGGVDNGAGGLGGGCSGPGIHHIGETGHVASANNGANGGGSGGGLGGANQPDPGADGTNGGGGGGGAKQAVGGTGSPYKITFALT